MRKRKLGKGQSRKRRTGKQKRLHDVGKKSGGKRRNRRLHAALTKSGGERRNDGEKRKRDEMTRSGDGSKRRRRRTNVAAAPKPKSGQWKKSVLPSSNAKRDGERKTRLGVTQRRRHGARKRLRLNVGMRKNSGACGNREKMLDSKKRRKKDELRRLQS